MSQHILPAGAATAPEGSQLRLSWLHPAGLVSLSLVNFVLRVLTLGIYHFWGKTEVRKRLWSAVRVEGEPLVYTGTGKELLLGFLIVFVAILLPLTLLLVGVMVAFGPQSPAIIVAQMLFYALLFFLLGIGIYRARLYRLSRTTWRGIRGSLAGSSLHYAWTHFWTGALVPLTLGWIMPWRATRLTGILTNDMRFGSRPFSFQASAGPLYGRFAFFWIAMLLTVAVAAMFAAGIIGTEIARFDPESAESIEPSFVFLVELYGLFAVVYLVYAVVGSWYRAFQINYFTGHTRFESANFKSNVSAAGLVWIGVTNFLIIVFTLGLLTPVAQARVARYLVEHTAIEGTVPLAAIEQTADAGPKRGEGLAQAFDVDLGGF